MNITKEVLDLVKVGNKLKVFYNEGNSNNETIHIRGIIDKDQVIVRKWINHCKDWKYRIEWIYWFEILLKDKQVKKI
jgi:hypothetical protein